VLARLKTFGIALESRDPAQSAASALLALVEGLNLFWRQSERTQRDRTWPSEAEEGIGAWDGGQGAFPYLALDKHSSKFGHPNVLLTAA